MSRQLPSCFVAMILCLLFFAINTVYGMGVVDLTDPLEKDPEDRQFPVLIATGLNLNNTLTLAALAALGALAGLIPLLGLAGLFAGLLLNQNSHGHGGYGSHTDSGYSSYSSARALGLDFGNWDNYSLMDWFSIGEETFRKFDPSDLECYKRLICEIHQNQKDFGFIATKVVQAFSYLEYARFLGLPESVLGYVDEYKEAANVGKAIAKDCGLIYPTCSFSVKTIVDRFSKPSLNNI